jgi:thiosulfate/3-mercaptopyruvate sulfurtransferase
MAEAGVDPDRPIIASCGSGTSACALLLALETLETTGHRLYDGSWTEWAGSGMPVESRVPEKKEPHLKPGREAVDR